MSRYIPGLAWRVLVAGSLLALPACGSTAQQRVVAPDARTAPDEAGVADEFAGQDAPAAQGASTRATRPGATNAAAIPGRSGGSTPAVRAGGELLVGAYGARISLNEGDIGITGIALGDNVRQFEAVAAWVNANGGMGGRKVKLVIRTQDVVGDATGSGSSRSTQDQAACAAFTEDNRAFAVVSHASATDAFYGCLAKRGVIHVANTSTASSAANFAQYRGLLFASAPTQDRVAVTLADELARVGYFADRPMKLGVFRFDHPWWADAAKAFRERAAARGVRVAEERTACQGCRDSAAQHQAAVLRFNATGVTHLVMFGDANLTLQFMIEAASQGYRPRYGLSSYNAPQLLATNQGAALQGAVGAGFEPALDVDKAQEPPPSAPDGLCRKILADAGEPAEDSRFELAQAHHTCEGLFLLKAVLDRAARADATAFLSAVESLGTSYVPVLTVATRFGPGRHDGASAYRPLAFDSACNCFRYTGSVMPFAA